MYLCINNYRWLQKPAGDFFFSICNLGHSDYRMDFMTTYTLNIGFGILMP